MGVVSISINPATPLCVIATYVRGHALYVDQSSCMHGHQLSLMGFMKKPQTSDASTSGQNRDVDGIGSDTETEYGCA